MMPWFTTLLALLAFAPAAKEKSDMAVSEVSQSTAAQVQMPALVQQYQADQGALTRLYTIDFSPNRGDRIRKLFKDWQVKLAGLNFDRLIFDDQIDYLLFSNYLERELRQLDIKEKEYSESAPLVPFAQLIIEMEESRRRMETVDPEKRASELNDLAKQLKELKRQLGDELKADKFDSNRAAGVVRSLRETLKRWFDFYNGYDPIFTWWVEQPYKTVYQELDEYGKALREKLVGVKSDDQDAIVGNPIGREALLVELKYELIPYSPEELIQIAEREYAWCEAEMKRASKELGFGEDWKKALEHVKEIHVEPGKQPELIRELAVEAIGFLEDRDLVTIPPLAKETWRMEMMSPERQKVSPFFLGGETIIVSYPTNTTEHDFKRMSMRGNNRHFSRATVQHELIPGHHLQQFMNSRYKTHRRMFGTPFWTEGWALWWEMLLWDQGFPKSPEDRIGMLFWRMHRCARIVFSLKFHLGEMTPQECIDYLIEKVGHERANAEGEVRRSFNGSYGPLYQLAYMIGGLQFRALHKELVGSGKMTNKQFHDAILQENNMPVEFVRAVLTRQRLAPNFRSTWRFAG